MHKKLENWVRHNQLLNPHHHSFFYTRRNADRKNGLSMMRLSIWNVWLYVKLSPSLTLALGAHKLKVKSIKPLMMFQNQYTTSSGPAPASTALVTPPPGLRLNGILTFVLLNLRLCPWQVKRKGLQQPKRTVSSNCCLNWIPSTNLCI